LPLGRLKDSLKGLNKWGNVALNNSPDSIEIDNVVAVNQNVPQAYNLPPRDAGECGMFLAWNLCACLADNLREDE